MSDCRRKLEDCRTSCRPSGPLRGDDSGEAERRDVGEVMGEGAVASEVARQMRVGCDEGGRRWPAGESAPEKTEGGLSIGVEEAPGGGRGMAGDGRSMAGDRTPKSCGGAQPAGGALHPWAGGRMLDVDCGRIMAGEEVADESTEDEPDCAASLPTLRAPAKRATTACLKSDCAEVQR